MTQSNHTPGPWIPFALNDRLKTWVVLCNNDKHCPGRGKQQIAAQIRTEADAKILAAAPQLLKACKEAYRAIYDINDHDGGFPVDEAYRTLEAAIEQAEKV